MDDDQALRDKLALLEAEVKADADAQAARKSAALEKVKAQRAAQQAERDELRQRQAALVTRKKAPEPEREIDHGDNFSGALELAGKANRVKQELARKPGKGEKSWVKSGIASAALGPIGWLYAGSFREAVPAAALWVGLFVLANAILPTVLLLPPLLVALGLSGFAGVFYAVQYNRHGSRQRLFGGDSKKQLPRGDG